MLKALAIYSCADSSRRFTLRWNSYTTSCFTGNEWTNHRWGQHRPHNDKAYQAIYHAYEAL